MSETVKALDEAVDRMEAARKEAEALVKDGIKGIVRALFDASPELLSIRWQQYTPHFNDGDACVFSVHGVYVRVSGEPHKYADDDGYVDEYGLERDGPLQLRVREFEKALGRYDSLLQTALGDHAQVTIERDGEVEVEEYDHD